MNSMLLTLAFLSPLAQRATNSSDFQAEAGTADAVYRPVLEANEALLLEGKLAESTRALLERVSESKRTAAHWFVLGNYLYSQDFELSYGLHQRAFELAPDEEVTQYEWALQRHRKREYAEAEALYSKLAAKPGEKDPRIHALQADCLLHLGKLAAAVESWKAADLRRRHTSVEEGFSWVYGDPNPIAERVVLLARAREAGVDPAQVALAIESLILLDLHWKTDWWNSRPHAEYLAADLRLAAEKLGKTSPRYLTLALLADAAPKSEKAEFGLRDEGTKKRLLDAHAVGADVPLPVNSRVASELIRVLDDHDCASPQELLTWYETTLSERAKSEPGDAQALELLASLYESSKRTSELASLEELGWKKFGAIGCVLGILDRKGEKIAADDPLLKDALAKFPDNVHLARIVMAIAHRDHRGEQEAIVAFLQAHLAHLVSWQDGAKSGFIALEESLAK